MSFRGRDFIDRPLGDTVALVNEQEGVFFDRCVACDGVSLGQSAKNS